MTSTDPARVDRGASSRALGCRVLALVAVLATVMIVVPNPALAQVEPLPDDVRQALLDDGAVRLVVELRSDAGSGGLSAQMASAETAHTSAALDEVEGITVDHEMRTVPYAVVTAISVDAVQALLADPTVADVMVDLPISGAGAVDAAMAMADDPSDKGAILVGADEYHRTGFDGSGVRVAVLDTGVDSDHPDLAGSVVFERCFLENAASQCPNGDMVQSGAGAAEDDHGHGTAVTSMITSDGIEAPIGSAPAATIEAYKILNAFNTGSASDPLVALDFINAQRMDVDLINLSFATGAAFAGDCDTAVGSLSESYAAVLAQLRQRGVLAIAAAGNTGNPNAMSFPACLSDVVAVAATATDQAIASFSNVSESADLGAPGDQLSASLIGGGTNVVSGTSFSAPLATGCAALFHQMGVNDPAALATRLASPAREVTGTIHQVPYLECTIECDGRPVTHIVAAGQTQGSDGDDVMLGSLGGDVIDAKAGDDVVCARAGNDRVHGGDGADVVFGGDGLDRLWGDAGPDELHGNGGDDRLHGNEGDDTLLGQLGDDRLYGYEDNDHLSGGRGDDRLHGNGGDDLIEGNVGDDIAYGYDGHDALRGGFGDDLLAGGRGDDDLSGSHGNDDLRGGSGVDVMRGDSLDDILRGGAGDDSLDGGVGIDECWGDEGVDATARCELNGHS